MEDKIVEVLVYLVLNAPVHEAQVGMVARVIKEMRDHMDDVAFGEALQLALQEPKA